MGLLSFILNQHESGNSVLGGLGDYISEREQRKRRWMPPDYQPRNSMEVRTGEDTPSRFIAPPSSLPVLSPVGGAPQVGQSRLAVPPALPPSEIAPQMGHAISPPMMSPQMPMVDVGEPPAFSARVVPPVTQQEPDTSATRARRVSAPPEPEWTPPTEIRYGLSAPVLREFHPGAPRGDTRFGQNPAYVPLRPADAFTPALNRASDARSTSDRVSAPSPVDVGTLPPTDRFSAVQAAGSGARVSPPFIPVDPSQQMPPRAAVPVTGPTDLGGGSVYTPPDPNDLIFRDRQLNPPDMATKLADFGQQLRDAPAKKVSRWRAFFEGLRRGGILGGVSGAIDPQPYAEFKKRQGIAENDDALKRIQDAQESQVGIDYKRAQIDAARGKGDKQAKAEAKTRLNIRRQQRGGKLDLSDPDTKADLALLGINGMSVPSGMRPIPGVNIKWNPVLGKWQYSAIDGDSGRPTMVTMDEDTQQPVRMSESDRRRYELDRQRHNQSVAEYVARYGAAAAEAAGLRVMPSLEEEEAQAAIAAGSTLQPASPETQQIEENQAGTPPESRALPNATRTRRVGPPAIPAGLPEKERPYGGGSGPYSRGGYGGRRRGGFSGGGGPTGSGISKGDSIAYGGNLQKAISDLEYSNEQYRAAQRRGDRAAAQSHAERAQAIYRTIHANPNFRGKYDDAGVNIQEPELPPAITMREQAAPPSRARGRGGRASAPKKGRISRADIPKIAQENGITEAEAERQLSNDYIIEP